MVKKNVKMNIVEEDLVLDMKFVNETGGSIMIADTRALLSIESKRRMIEYIDEKKFI